MWRLSRIISSIKLWKKEKKERNGYVCYKLRLHIKSLDSWELKMGKKQYEERL